VKNIDPLLSPERVLATDDDLADLLSRLLERANMRQVWLIMLGADDRVTGPLMPLEDFPSEPDAECDTADLGTLTHSRLLAARFAAFAEMCDAERIVLVWERRGTSALRAGDLAWARAMARDCREAGVALRAQFVLHDRGLRTLAVDDLL
jgi:hypothetical protein